MTLSKYSNLNVYIKTWNYLNYVISLTVLNQNFINLANKGKIRIFCSLIVSGEYLYSLQVGNHIKESTLYFKNKKHKISVLPLKKLMTFLPFSPSFALTVWRTHLRWIKAVLFWWLLNVNSFRKRTRFPKDFITLLLVSFLDRRKAWSTKKSQNTANQYGSVVRTGITRKL